MPDFAQSRNRDLGTQFVRLLAGNDDGVFYFEGENTIASVCVFAPMVGWSNHTATALTTLLNTSVPAGTIMQFINMGSPHIDATLHDYFSDRAGVAGDQSVYTAQHGVAERAAFLQQGTRDRLIAGSDVRVLESLCLWTIKCPLKTRHPFNGNDKDDKAFAEECNTFVDLRTQMLAQLSVAGVEASVMHNAQALGLLRRYFSMYEPWDTRIDPDTPLNDQLFPPGSKLDWSMRGSNTLHASGFSFSGERQHMSMLVIDQYPGKDHPHHFSQMIKMLGNPPGNGPQIGMPYTLTTTIHFPDQTQKAVAVRKAHMLTEKQSNKLMLAWSPRLRRKREGFQAIAETMMKGGNVVETSTTLCVYHRSSREISRSLATMASYYRTLGFIMRRERYISEVSFFNQLPMNASAESIRHTHRFKTMGGEHAAHLLPILDEWQGLPVTPEDRSKGYVNEMLLTTRLGRLFQYSLFHPTNKNYNWTMIAGTGAGKSFFVQRLTQDLLSVGTKIWTIDTGSSYLAAARVAGAQIIDFGFESDICLNPFSKITDLHQEMELLLPIFAKMVKPVEGFTDKQRSLCEEAIRSVFMARGNHADIDDVLSFLNTQTGDMASEQRELALLLSAFGSTGSMGRWFKGANNLRTEADWTVLELSGLTTNKHLCDVVLMMISTSIAQEMFTARDGRRRMLIVEEGGDRVTDTPFAEFVAKLVAKVRKEDGSVGVVVQTFNQMHATEHGKTIMASAGTQFYMQQTSEAIEDAIERKWLSVDAHTQNLLRDVHTEKGQFSELVVRSGTSAGIARLVETPFNRVLFSTEGEFFKVVQAKVRAGENVTGLIHAEANRRYAKKAKM